MNNNDLPNDDLLQFVFGELDDARQAAMRKAIAQDAELAAVAQGLEAAVAAVRAESVGQVRDEFNDRLRRRVSEVFAPAQAETTRPTFLSRSLTTWKWIMRHPVSHAAAAAIFVLAIGGVALWFHAGGTTPAFADYLTPILDAKTVKYKITTERTSLPAGMTNIMGLSAEAQKDLMKATSAKVMKLDSNRSRIEWELPGNRKTVQIWDGGQGKGLWLYPAEKRATVSNITNMPKNKSPNGRDPVAYYRSLLLDARDKPDVTRESLGEKQIDGRQAVGFRISSPAMLMCVWGDPKTGLPVRVETTAAIMPNIKLTMSDFVFNVDMDESLFSLEPPAGYEVVVQDRTNDDAPSTEKDLIEMFRYYSEVSGGRFPDLLDMEWISQTVSQQEWCAANLAQPQKTMAQRRQENAGAQAKLNRGMMFSVLLPKEADAHYAGKGVSLGAADTPIFWYRPKDAKKYRVIYADLSVHEAETPPSVPDANLENDLIEMFRQYCQLSDGPFPAKLDMGSIIMMPTIKWRSHNPLEQPQKRSAKEEQEIAEALAKLLRGLRFIGLLPKEADSNYAGKGVSLGAVDTPIFWYRPKDSRKYRVVYADLTVRDADATPSVHVAPPEQELIDALGEYNKLAGDDFPDSLDIQAMMEMAGRKVVRQMFLEMCTPENGNLSEEQRHKIEELLHKLTDLQKHAPEKGEPNKEQMAKIDEQMNDLIDWEKLAPGKKDLSKKQKTKYMDSYSQKFTQGLVSKIIGATMRIQPGLAFVSQLPPDADAHYAGKGVSLGAADTPIFWYRPKDSKNYRVIYADLSVRDADTPPSAINAQPASSPSIPKK